MSYSSSNFEDLRRKALNSLQAKAHFSMDTKPAKAGSVRGLQSHDQSRRQFSQKSHNRSENVLRKPRNSNHIVRFELPEKLQSTENPTSTSTKILNRLIQSQTSQKNVLHKNDIIAPNTEINQNVNENDIEIIDEKSFLQSIKACKSAVYDLKSMGYNFYDLVALAGVSPQFLAENFTVPSNLLKNKRKHEDEESSPLNLQVSNLEPKKLKPSPPSTKSPPISNTITSSPQSPIFAASQSQENRQPSYMKFGTNRWAESVDIIISDDEEDEMITKKSLESVKSQATSQPGTPLAYNGSSKPQNILEQIQKLKEQIARAEKENPKINSSTPNLNTSTLNTPNFANTPESLTRTTSPILHLEPDTTTLKLNELQQKLEVEMNALNVLENDKIKIVEEKDIISKQLQELSLDTLQAEIVQLQALIQQKIQEQKEKIKLSTVLKAKLEVANLRETSLSNLISEVNSRISATQREIDDHSFQNLKSKNDESSKKIPTSSDNTEKDTIANHFKLDANFEEVTRGEDSDVEILDVKNTDNGT